MKITPTGIAIALAVAVALGFITLIPKQSAPAQDQAAAAPAPADTSTTQPTTMNDLPKVLTIKDEVVGTGAVAVAGTPVTVQYVGMLPDGKVFDASKNHGDQGFTFTLGGGQVIKGWDMGVVGMKVGGKRQLIIPADMAYGANVIPGVIPPNATLIFEVELISVGK